MISSYYVTFQETNTTLENKRNKYVDRDNNNLCQCSRLWIISSYILVMFLAVLYTYYEKEKSIIKWKRTWQWACNILFISVLLHTSYMSAFTGTRNKVPYFVGLCVSLKLSLHIAMATIHPSRKITMSKLHITCCLTTLRLLTTKYVLWKYSVPIWFSYGTFAVIFKLFYNLY